MTSTPTGRSARGSRSTVPTASALGLTSPHAASDLERLGWNNEESIHLLWLLADVGDPELALNTLYRLTEAVEDMDELITTLRNDATVRTRMLALLGGSAALGDHLVANPSTWPLLGKPLPTRAEMMHTMLSAVGAHPAAGVSTGSPDLDEAGTYVATIVGPDANRALKQAYRTLQMRIAAVDLASTLAQRKDADRGSDNIGFVEVSGALTDLADAGLTAALAVANRTVYGDKDVSSRLAVLAMGKCGARELNYISDVDVIFVSEPADATATRVASEFIRVGSSCFFDVDAALRPEGKRGALVRTLESHIAYYNRWAQTWEFQAQLKARPMTGDLELGAEYTQALGPKVWQACERESFVDDTQAMRRRVVDNIPKDQAKRELKLGEGGLRDVEFAVQLLQMVHGRTDTSLHVKSTIDALNALIDGGYIGREDGKLLIECYESMRLWEHRLQLQRCKRTHLLPEDNDDTGMRWLARASGIAPTFEASSEDALRAIIRQTSHIVHSLHNKLFFRPLLNSVVSIDADTMRLSPDAARRQLAALGYKFPDRAFEHLSALAAGQSRKARIQTLLLPTLMEWLGATPDPDAGLLAYRKLCEVAYENKLRWFLRLLRDEGIVGQRLMQILGTSPYATDLLLASPETIQLLSDGASGPKLIDANSSITRSLVATAGRHKDPEKAITAARSLRRKELARIACADILGLMDIDDVCRGLSLVWEAVLEAALLAETKAWKDAHPDQEVPALITVIGMGRLGGAELGYGSDADVMFVCEPTAQTAPGETVDVDEEARAVKWAISIVDSLRSRLAKPSQDPPLSVDLDLRPEGRNGATVRTLASYQAYYERWGETWEVQALLRATWIAGDRSLGLRFLHMIDEFRYPEGGVSEKTVREVRRMKARVDEERLPRGADRKTHTKLGRGALTDIEWTVQLLTLQYAHQYPELHNTSTLETLAAIEELGLMPVEDCEKLRTAWLTATKARNALVLVRGKRTDQLPQPGPQLAHVAGAAGWRSDQNQQFMEHYLKVTRQARSVVDRVFWGEEETVASDYE